MASPSEDTVARNERTNASITQAAQGTSRAQARRGRIDSTDITYLGGWFVESSNEAGREYATQLEISEEEDAENPPNYSYQSGHLPQHSSPRHHDGVPSHASPASSASTSRTPTLTRAHSQPYLQPGDFERLGLRRANGRSRSRRMRGSARRTSNSSSASVDAYAPSTSTSTTATLSTTHDHHNNDNDDERGYTPYFSPSHTPSHHSMATVEDAEGEIRAPTSPLPYSTYHTYDAHYARGVVDEFEHQINQS